MSEIYRSYATLTTLSILNSHIATFAVSACKYRNIIQIQFGNSCIHVQCDYANACICKQRCVQRQQRERETTWQHWIKISMLDTWLGTNIPYIRVLYYRYTWLIHLQYYYCKIFHELLFVYIYLPFARIVVQKTLFISFRYVLVKKILFIVSHCGVLHLCLYYLWSNYERFKLVQGFHVIYIEIFQLILL